MQLLLLCALLAIVSSVRSASQFAFQDETNVTHNSRVNNVQCFGMPYQRTKLNYCKMGTFPNQAKYLNVSVDVPMVLHYFIVRIQLCYKYTSYRPFMVDWRIEVCDTLRRPDKHNPVTQLVLQAGIFMLPEFYYNCPHGNRTYSTVWAYPAQYVLNSIPSGDYRVDATFTTKDETLIIAVRIYMNVRKRPLIG